MRRISIGVLALGLGLGAACGAGSTTTDPSDSEVATGVVSGALNNGSGTTVGWNDVPTERPSVIDRVVDSLNPISTAYAATWSCSGDTLTPAYAGPGNNPYTFTPVSCMVTWDNGKSASAKWSSTFTLNYGSSCDNTHAFIGNQVGNCSVTRTTAAGGNTRTLTGPDGNSYAITHDTNGAGTGWDATVSPAPSSGGVVATCAAGGCSAGGTLVINGSHLTGTVTPAGGQPITVWNHTVSTGASGLTVTGNGVNRVLSGLVTVQHNILKYTAATTFNSVGYGEIGCCFPTSGSVSTSFHNGPHSGKSESLAFSNICGEATLTTFDGNTVPVTLQHCL